MYYTFATCKLGWFYGTKEEDYREDCAQCIKKIASLLGLENQDIVLYGSSGGGTAAIGTSKYLRGCSVVAINPQLFFENYPDTGDFEDSTGIQLRNIGDKFGRNDNCELVRSNEESHYILLCNVRCNQDYLQQLIPFCERMDISPVYGLATTRHITTWVYNAVGVPSEHSSFENITIFKMIDFLLNCIIEGTDIGSLRYLFNVVNDFWYERYSLLRNNKNLTKQMEKLRSDLKETKTRLEISEKSLTNRIWRVLKKLK